MTFNVVLDRNIRDLKTSQVIYQRLSTKVSSGDWDPLTKWSRGWWTAAGFWCRLLLRRQQDKNILAS